MGENYMFQANVKDIDLKFQTSNNVFSPKNINKGTLAMLLNGKLKSGRTARYYLFDSVA
jgi:16S rRNA G1207 methylase RsmC